MLTFFVMTLLFLICFIPILFEEKIANIIFKDISTAIHEQCKSCVISAEETHLSLFPPTFIIKSMHFHGGSNQTTAIDAVLDYLEIPFSFSKLLKKTVRIGKVKMHGLSVLVTEGDLKVLPSSHDFEDSHWQYEVQTILISAAKFTYKRIYRNFQANIHVTDLNATVGPFGNITTLNQILTRAEVNARLEKSGSFQLNLESAIHSNIVNLDVDLQMNNQNLHDLSSFFAASGQMMIKGDLISGHSNIKISKNQLVGNVRARYKSLAIKFQKNSERSEFATFLLNLAQSFTIHSSDLLTYPENQMRTVELKRQKNETLISFILHGMKNAALGIATDN